MKNATSPDEVTYPDETLVFAFVEAESANKACSCLTYCLPKGAGGICQIGFSGRVKLYAIGKKVTKSGIQFVQNSHAGTFILFKESVEIIPE